MDDTTKNNSLNILNDPKLQGQLSKFADCFNP